MLVSRKERPTGGGEILCFIYLFVIMQTCMLQKMCNSAPWGHPFWWVAEFGVTPAIGIAELIIYETSQMQPNIVPKLNGQGRGLGINCWGALALLGRPGQPKNS